jgi:hypothetical protein
MHTGQARRAAEAGDGKTVAPGRHRQHSHGMGEPEGR